MEGSLIKGGLLNISVKEVMGCNSFSQLSIIQKNQLGAITMFHHLLR